MTSLNTGRDVKEKNETDNTVVLVTGMTSAGETAVIAEDGERITLFIWILVGCCCISGLLFGEH